MLAKVVCDTSEYSRLKRPQLITDCHKMTRKICKEDGLVSFKDMTSGDIYALYRAISHQVPLHCKVGRYQVVFKRIRDQGMIVCPLNYDPEKWPLDSAILPPGTIFLERPTRSLWMKTVSGWMSCDSFHLSTTPITLDGCQMMSALHGKSMTPLFV